MQRAATSHHIAAVDLSHTETKTKSINTQIDIQIESSTVRSRIELPPHGALSCLLKRSFLCINNKI